MEQKMIAKLPVCVCGSLRQVSRAVTQLYDEALRPVGLRAMQFQILMTVRGMGEPTLTSLTRMLTIDQTTLTRSMALLERQGWVKRVPRVDRRLKAYQLTEEGAELLGRAEAEWAKVQGEVLEKLGVESWENTREQLQRLLGLVDGGSIRFPDRSE